MPALKLLSSMATREVLAELVARYQRDTGVAVEAQAGGGVDVARRIAAGEACDVVVLAADAIDRLIVAKQVCGARIDIVRSSIAVAVRAGGPRPAMASEADVKAAVLDAPTLSYSTGPSGVYLESLFERWGILEQVRGRIVVPPPGVAVGSLVAEGRAALGFQQFAELMNVPGIIVLGPLPDAIQSMTTFSGALCASSTCVDEAGALLDYLASPATLPLKQRCGMDAP